MKQIIAIQGYKNSGKDEVGEMLKYILNTPSFLHSYKLYKLLKPFLRYSKNKFHTVSYAEKLKQAIAALLNVDRSFLDNRDFKENYYVDFNTLTIYHKDEVNEDKILNDSRFAKEIKRLDKGLTINYFLSVRQILQYYGTQVMRSFFGEDLGILCTLKSKYNKIIITDQRFINEHKRSVENKAIVIHITRPNTKPGVHSSESELEELLNKKMYNFLIENNSTFEHLFNGCKKIVKTL